MTQLFGDDQIFHTLVVQGNKFNTRNLNNIRDLNLPSFYKSQGMKRIGTGEEIETCLFDDLENNSDFS